MASTSAAVTGRGRASWPAPSGEEPDQADGAVSVSATSSIAVRMGAMGAHTTAAGRYLLSRAAGAGASGVLKPSTKSLNSWCRKSAPNLYCFISLNACSGVHPSPVMR
jgi:hypothetical protein